MPDSDLILNVRQIAGYTNLGIQGTDDVLIQRGGLGGPYLSVSAQQFVSGALAAVGDMTIAGTLTANALNVDTQANMNILTVDQLTVDVQANIDTLAVDALTVDAQANIRTLVVDALSFASTPTVVTSVNGRVGNVTLSVWDVCGAAPLNSPWFTGQPVAPTPSFKSCSDRLATTAFVHGVITVYLDNFAQGQFVTSFNGRTGAIVLTAADITAAGATTFAPIMSPDFSGIPTGPTAPPGSQTGQLATTAFVMNAVQESTTGVASFNGRTGIVTLSATDVTGAGGAPIASPIFTGVPQAPLPAPGANTAQLATCAWVMNEIGGSGGVVSFNGRTGAIVLTSADLTSAGGALLNGPAFSGIPTAPTAPAATNSTQLATCAFVTQNAVTSFNGRTGPVTLLNNDISAANGLINPSAVMTGTPTAPTAAPSTNTTQVATCAFVQAAIAAISSGVVSFNTRTGAVTLSQADVITALPASTTLPLMNGTAAAGTAVAWARGDHVHPTDTSRYSATNPSGFQTASQVSSALSAYLPLSGGTLTGQLVAPGVTSTSGVNVSGGTINGPGGGTIGGVSLIGSAATYTGNPGLADLGDSAGIAFGFASSPTGGSYGALSLAANVVFSGYCIRSVPVQGSAFGAGMINIGPAYATMNVYGDGGSGVWSITPSDGRLKLNRSPCAKDALAIVGALEVDQCDFRHPSMSASEHWDFTVVAEDVQRILPYAYIAPPADGYSSVHPLHLVTVLWRAVQQLSERLQALEQPA